MSVTIIPGHVYDKVLLSKENLWCDLHIWLSRSQFSSLGVSLCLIIVISSDYSNIIGKIRCNLFSILVRNICHKGSGMLCYCRHSYYKYYNDILFPISQSADVFYHIFVSFVIFVAFSVWLWFQGNIFIVLSRIKRTILTKQIP